MVYTEDLPALIERHEIKHHLYADDIQLSDDQSITSVAASISNMDHCIDAVHTRFSSKRLQLNPTKTEIFWFETRASLKRLQHIRLHIGTVVIKPTSVVRDLGVLLDSELSMRQHISKAHGTLLLSSSPPEEGPAYTGPHYHMQTGVCFRLESTRLLQLNSGCPFKVHHCAPITRPECSGTSGVRFRPT